MGADIDQRHPDVRDNLFNWGTWIHSILGDCAAGFRFDAIKHIDEDFIVGFIKHVRQGTGQPNLFAVGEFWSHTSEEIFRYLDGFGTQVRWCETVSNCEIHEITHIQFSVFDSPLHYNFNDAANAGRNYDIRKIWDGSVVKSRPVDAVCVPVPLPEPECLLCCSTLVDNHE